MIVFFRFSLYLFASQSTLQGFAFAGFDD